MGWKQCVISIQDNYERLHEGVRLLALANKDSAEIALFTRTMPDHRHRVLLLSPLAAELAGDALSERWTASEAPELFEWDLVHGSPGACEHFGLCRPSFRRAQTPPLIFGAEHKPD